MCKLIHNGIEAAKIIDIELTNGHIYKDYFLDPFTSAPAGFIALRAAYKTQGQPDIIKFVKVSSIASFDIEEGEAGKLWDQFDTLPETIAAKQI